MRRVISSVAIGLFLALVQLPNLYGQNTQIEVDPTVVNGKISRDLFGVNHRYPWNGFGMWDPVNNEPYPLFVTRFKQAKFSLVRFPAGTYGNLYQWKRAIGPRYTREQCFLKENLPPAATEFGPDEYGKFLEMTGAAGVIMVNASGNSNAKVASDFVEYMNGKVNFIDGKWVGENRNGGIDWAAVRADPKGGKHPKPYNVKYWEIGNEMNPGTIQSYWIGECPQSLYAEKYCLGGSTDFAKQNVGQKSGTKQSAYTIPPYSDPPISPADDFRETAGLSDGKRGQTKYAKYPPMVVKAIIPGKDYTISGFVKRVNTNLEALIRITAYWYDGNRHFLSDTVIGTLKGGTDNYYVKLSKIVKPPSGSKRVKIALTVSNGTVGEVFFDDIVFTEKGSEGNWVKNSGFENGDSFWLGLASPYENVITADGVGRNLSASALKFILEKKTLRKIEQWIGIPVVYVNDNPWICVDDLRQVGPGNFFQIDPLVGSIKFGNNTHGKIPPTGATITISYESGHHDGFVDYYREMKKADPDIQIYSCRNDSSFSDIMAEVMDPENPKYNPYAGFDGIVMHPYCGLPNPNFLVTPEDYHDWVMHQADTLARRIAEKQKESGNTVVASEYGLYRLTFPTTEERYLLSLDHGLFTGLMLKSFIELSMPFACKHALISYDWEDPNNPEMLEVADQADVTIMGPLTYIANPDLEKSFIKTAVGHVMSLFSQMTGTEWISSRVINNPTRRILSKWDLSVLSVISTKDQNGDLCLIAINRDRDRDVPVKVVFDNYVLDDPNATVWTVNSTDGRGFLSYNTPEKRDNVTLQKHKVVIGSTSFSYNFRAHSITAMKITGHILH